MKKTRDRVLTVIIFVALLLVGICCGWNAVGGM